LKEQLGDEGDRRHSINAFKIHYRKRSLRREFDDESHTEGSKMLMEFTGGK
jgi:hypothetical protein